MNPASICELGPRAAVAIMSEDDWDELIVRTLNAPDECVALARQCAEHESRVRSRWSQP